MSYDKKVEQFRFHNLNIDSLKDISKRLLDPYNFLQNIDSFKDIFKIL